MGEDVNIHTDSQLSSSLSLSDHDELGTVAPQQTASDQPVSFFYSQSWLL